MINVVKSLSSHESLIPFFLSNQYSPLHFKVQHTYSLTLLIITRCHVLEYRNITQIKMVLISDSDIRVYSPSRIFWTTLIHSWIMRSCVIDPGVLCNIPSDHTYYLVTELCTSEWETGLEAGVRSYFPHRLHTYGTHHTQTSELYRFCTLIRRGIHQGGRESRRQWNVHYVMISPRYVLRATFVSWGEAIVAVLSSSDCGGLSPLLRSENRVCRGGESED